MSLPKRIRQTILTLALGCYNAAASVVLLLVLWKNHLWNEKRWAGHHR